MADDRFSVCAWWVAAQEVSDPLSGHAEQFADALHGCAFIVEGFCFGPLESSRRLDHFVDDFAGPFDDERTGLAGNDFGIGDAVAALGVDGFELGHDGGLLPLDSLEHGDQLAHRREYRVVGLIRFHVGECIGEVIVCGGRRTSRVMKILRFDRLPTTNSLVDKVCRGRKGGFSEPCSRTPTVGRKGPNRRPLGAMQCVLPQEVLRQGVLRGIVVVMHTIERTDSPLEVAPGRARRATAMTPSSIAIYLLGCLLFSIGANFFIYSALGTDPLDVFALGMVDTFDFMTVGIAQVSFALVCLALWSLWNKRRPILSPLITFALCGTLIDIFMGKRIRVGDNYASHVPLSPWPLMICGVFLCAFGSALIIMSGVGIRSMDLLAITVVQKTSLPFWAAKGIMEVVLLTVGWLLGGPVGWGTVFFLLFVGWLIQPLMWFNAKYLGMANRGLTAH